ncbi:unnamed protein product [Dicrocoelium dendriticum]|nr:unnamed protein product [Dicrocoelium dendriticum]
MSLRFNPVTLLTRRRSKSKSKGRSKSVGGRTPVGTSCELPPDKESWECKDDPNFPRHSMSPKPRLRLLSSLRRTRSARHPAEDEWKEISSKDSPPLTSDQLSKDRTTIPNSPHSQKENDSESPAPLAQNDCFELTDISDTETEESPAQYNITPQTTGIEQPRRKSEEASDADHSTPQKVFGDEDTDEEITEKGLQVDDSESELESEELTSGSHPSLFGTGDDNESQVPKLEVQYDTEYPVCELSGSIVSLSNGLAQRNGVDTDPTESESTVGKADFVSTPVISSEEQSGPEGMEDFKELSPEQKASEVVIKDGYQQPTEQRDIVVTAIESEVEPTFQQIADFDNSDTPINQEPVDHLEPSFEVTYDPLQDPFFAAEVAAHEGEHQMTVLVAPSIIVTSASTGSLKQYVEAEPIEPPSRPPPPAATVPKRPPLPSVPPPRPGTGPVVSTEPSKSEQHRKKKRKLLGIVDLGPLPSDPDPNFPFRKHLEKSVVPNPKKAIQRIIRGETKAERQKRKEREELDRLLKGAEAVPQKSSSEDWETFHNLTAEIEHAVLEKSSKSNEIIPAYETTDLKEKEESAEGWANFEAAFSTEVTPTPILTENPWEGKEESKAFEPFFYFNAEGSEQIVTGRELTPEQPDSTYLNLLYEPHYQNDWPADILLSSDKDVASGPTESISSAEVTKDLSTLLDLSSTVVGTQQPPVALEVSQEYTQPRTEVLTPPTMRPMTEVTPTGIEEHNMNTESQLSRTQVDTFVLPANAEHLGPKATQLSETDSTVALDNGAEEPAQFENVHRFPDKDGLDPSDADEETSDDLLWGGFGEVHADDVGADISPFGGDDFSLQHPSSQDAGDFIKTAATSDIVRPRKKAVRQETLSGNNPFRKREEEDEPEISELVRAAAGIELTGTRVGVRKQYGAYESSNDSGEDNKIECVGDIQPTEQVDEKWKLEEVEGPSFDPLQTIYPESENESASSEEQQSDHIPALSVVIGEKPIQLLPEPSSKELNSVIKALSSPNDPDKPTEVLLLEKEVLFGESDTNKQSGDALVNQTIPTGWIRFSGDSQEPEEETGKPVLATDAAFEVDWSTTATKPEPERPVAPRPDTPDPELDEPFYPLVEEGTWFKLWLRFPEKKTRVKQISKYTTDRYWREVGLQFVEEHGRKVINLHELCDKTNEIVAEPYRSVRIEPYMQISREKLQQYDKYGKLHVFKLNHVSYREFVGIRPEKFSIKNLQKLVTHKPKQNIAIDHLPVYTEILKFGSLDQQKIRTIMPVFEDALMKIAAHKDSTLSYQREEVCCYVVDEYIGKVSAQGTIQEQKARCRILCTAFVNGGPHIVLGLNDKWRYGREVVRRSDILPVMHDEWISIRNPEFHSCVEMDAYEEDHMLKFYPLDGCRFELLRFRVSLRRNRELPLLVSTKYSIDGRRVLMRCELLVPGFFSASNRRGAVPCENVEIRIPVPEDWIYHFRVEKQHKYGSVHSTLRKPGRIKGLERLTQMAQSLLPPNILEASTGLAKYEHLYRAIVWRIQRIPEKTEASLRPHLLACKLMLAPHDTVPEWDALVRECQVEYTMPSSTVSGATVRSISVEHTGVAEKFVKYTSKYKYTVGINYQLSDTKVPALKGIVDQPEDPVTPENKELEEHAGSEEYQAGEQLTSADDGEVADLLGLGDTFDTIVSKTSGKLAVSDSLSGLF